MKLHFANSAFIDAPERAVLRGGRWRKTLDLRVRYGILEHPRLGPVLIDTGYSSAVTNGAQRSFALRAYARATKPRLVASGQIGTVLGNLGYVPSDVTTIIVTHFHADHVAALSGFPNAKIITNLTALKTVLGRGHLMNIRHGIFTELLPDGLPDRVTDIASLPNIPAPLNLGVGRELFGDGTVIAIDLPGHAAGHFGLCFPGVDPALLYACDVQWVTQALSLPHVPPILSRLVSADVQAAQQSGTRVAEFGAAGGKVILCHDPVLTTYDRDQLEDV